MRGEPAEVARLKGGHTNSALISRLRAAASVSALRAAFGGCAPTRACGRSPSGKSFGTGGAFSPWGRRCPRPRPRTDEGRVCGGCSLKGDRANFALISRLRAAASVSALRAAFGGCAPTRACGRSPSGEAIRNGGAFSPWGRRCLRPRPRTDEGRVCGGCPFKGRPHKLRSHQPPAGGSFPRGGSL